MTSATAAGPVRVGLATVLVVLVAALAFAGRADTAGRAWSTYLAPAAACKGSEDASASPAAQRRAVACLINWARAQDRSGRLRQAPSLQRAAVIKGQKVVSCGSFSHTPCGSDPAAAARAAGYRYSTFGENLFAGTPGAFTPRAVVAAWLESPGHRANVLRPGFRHVGVSSVYAKGLLGGGDATVWVAAFGSPR